MLLSTQVLRSNKFGQTPTNPGMMPMLLSTDLLNRNTICVSRSSFSKIIFFFAHLNINKATYRNLGMVLVTTHGNRDLYTEI